MARVERFTSEEQIPVRQAQLVDPRSFPADTSSAEALRVAGETAKDIGLKLEQERKVKQELAKRKRDAQDRIGITNANAIMDNAEREYARRIIGKPLTEHESIRLDELNKARAKVSQLDLSPDAREVVDSNANIKADRFADIAELANIQATNRDALIKTSEAYETALIEGDVSSIDDAEVLLDEQLKNMLPAEAAKFKEELEERAIKQMEENAISEVHAAMEAENFGIARELAKNPIIPEPKQTTLRTAIRTAETVRTNTIKEEKKALIDKTTSDTIREYFGGELTVATLNERHAKGLIRDSEFKFMMTGLTQIAPDNSDVFANGKIRRAEADFAMGAISRKEADKIALENFEKLDVIDRESVIANLEDIEAKIIATAKSNAYSEGRGLMSQRFVGIQSEEELIDIFKGAGLTEEEKKRINRRWTAEVNNRDLYERAIDDRFKEMRKEGVSDSNKFRAESLSILLQYQRRGRLTLEELEEAVTIEQRKIIFKETKPVTRGVLKAIEEAKKRATVKPIDEMTTEEKQRELERIRELRKLIK